jgi:hypothetical protein
MQVFLVKKTKTKQHSDFNDRGQSRSLLYLFLNADLSYERDLVISVDSWCISLNKSAINQPIEPGVIMHTTS